MKKKFYITTTAPYVNANPHIGFALEIIQADVIARYKRQMGYEVVFGFGTDEHGLKIYRKAQEQGIDTLKYCNQYANKFKQLVKLLNLSTTHFIRTTDPKHIKAAQEFWMLCFNNGDIYKKNYKIKYCVGCELEKSESELIESKCPIHPNIKIEIIEEENYFFRFSKYQNKLLELYRNNKNYVVPPSRLKEIETFVVSGLEDFSVSRIKLKMPWGVDVPNDPNHVMYVWFDALVFYISTLGWPENKIEYEKFWPGIQIAGKDNLRQQSAIWQAMLMSAGLPNSQQILIHGFITTNNKKMSKSLGNVIDPFQIVKQYGVDAVRYYLLKEIPTFGDGDFAHVRMKEIYNADLANELGNLVSRITNIAEQDKIEINNNDNQQPSRGESGRYEMFQFNIVLEQIWKEIKTLNKSIDNFAPWKKNPDDRKNFLIDIINKIRNVAYQLQPFIPKTSEKILISTNGKIKKQLPLFPRIK